MASHAEEVLEQAKLQVTNMVVFVILFRKALVSGAFILGISKLN